MTVGSFLPEKKRRRITNTGFHTFRYRTDGLAAWKPYQTWWGITDEEIVSQCHTGLWPPPVGSRGNIGGPMDLHRTWDEYPVTSHIKSVFTEGEIGMASMIGYTYGLNPAVAASLPTMNTFGTSAIARVLPTNPNSSLSTALGELKKDGLPALPGAGMRERADLARRSGNEFLNIEFGWLPLISDVRSFANAVRHSKAIIDQYVRDSDQKIRRRYTPEELILTPTVFTGTGQAQGQNIECVNSTVTRTVSTRYWFSGAFRYHVPIDDGFYGRLLRYEALSAKLFDTRVTPELLWNLAPWSWAVDWFTNAGDVIHNISRLGRDGLVMQYGYAMRHMKTHEYHIGSYHEVDALGVHEGTVARSIGSEWKQRVSAHPYGFGITDTSLSAMQLAILAALGLTRGQRDGM